MATYTDWVAMTVVHGRRDVWSYVTFLAGLKMTQLLTAEKAATVLEGLRLTDWAETHKEFGNREVWEFRP